MASDRVFVTVGTTKFEHLIVAVTKPQVLQILASAGYREMLLQIGSGTIEPETGLQDGISVDWYRYKDSIAEDIKSSRLIITHGGAGTVIEALESKNLVVVVVNSTLMNNHQTELAKQFDDMWYLAGYTTPKGLARELETLFDENDKKVIKPYKPGNPKLLADYLDSIFGFDSVLEDDD